MATTRRSLLVAAGGTLAVAGGCLKKSLPLFQLDVYNATDSAVTVEVTVVEKESGSTVVSEAVRVPGVEGKRRKMVTKDFEKGTKYEAMASVGDRSKGKLFRANKEGARKLTFEVHEERLRAEFT